MTSANQLSRSLLVENKPRTGFLPAHSYLPPLSELQKTARVVALPMVTSFRGIFEREAVLFQGPAGWTEFAPFVEYDDQEAATWLAAAIDYGWHEPPRAIHSNIRVNATVPAVAADQVTDVLARFPGCRTAKVKVASPENTLRDDIARVSASRSALGDEGRVRIDANGGWNVDEAEHALRAMAQFDIEYVEQPCSTVAELAELRIRVRDLGVPIAADESVRKAADPVAVIAAGAADTLVLKAAPLGGIHAALDILAEAQKLSERSLGVTISSALDTSVGIAMGAALAAAIPELEYDCGLGTAALLASDVTANPLIPSGGTIPAARVIPEPDLLTQNAASAERTRWWLDRMSRCYGRLEQVQSG